MLTVNVAVRGPVAVGANVTVTVQLAANYALSEVVNEAVAVATRFALTTLQAGAPPPA